MIKSFIVCICMMVVSLQHTDGLIIEFQSSVLNQMLQYFKKPPEPVTLYVNIHSKNRMLACGPTELMTNSSQSNLYKWTRANGEEVPVSDSVSVSNNAELVFHRFLPEYSGEYHCNRVYSLGGFKLQKKFNSFVVYGFHEPSWNLNTWLDFISQGCDQTSNTALAHSVLNKLKTLLSSIGWEIDEKTTACSININNTSSPNLGIVHLEFTVYPNITWENVCTAESADKKDCVEVAEKSMEKAYTQMDDFFKNNKEFNDEVVGTFKMQLMNNSVAIYKIQLCQPGFGQDDGIKECQNCCVVCKPGMFSSPSSHYCHKCPSETYSSGYAEVTCTSCNVTNVTMKSSPAFQQQCYALSIIPQIVGGLSALIVSSIIIGLCVKMFLMSRFGDKTKSDASRDIIDNSISESEDNVELFLNAKTGPHCWYNFLLQPAYIGINLDKCGEVKKYEKQCLLPNI